MQAATATAKPKPTTAAAASAAPEADIAQPAEPVAWQIKHTGSKGTSMTELCGHNAIGDYRNFDPLAISTPLYAAPQAAAINADLLAALIEVVRISDRKHDAWDAAHAAIAKATGGAA